MRAKRIHFSYTIIGTPNVDENGLLGLEFKIAFNWRQRFWSFKAISGKGSTACIPVIVLCSQVPSRIQPIGPETGRSLYLIGCLCY